MLSKEEVKKWLLENCVNEVGNLDLDGLDFSDFNGDVYLSNMKVKWKLIQNHQEVGRDLRQNYQKVKGNLDQDNQEVDGNLFQCEQKVKRVLMQSHQEVGEMLVQCLQKVKGEIVQDVVDASALLHALNACESLAKSNLELLIAKAKAEADFKHNAMYAEFDSECFYREAREAAFKEAVCMAEQTASEVSRWVEFARGKQQATTKEGRKQRKC